MSIGRSVLACAALAALAILIPPRARAAEMSFRLVPVGDPGRCGNGCPLVIAAEGEITNETPDRFVQFVRESARQRNVRSVIFIDSPGGKVVSSMELGQAFRRLGVAAVVARPFESSAGSQFAAGHCYSACVYALMGGRTRVIPPQSKVGIHRMFTYDSASDPAGGTQNNMRHDDGGMREVLARYSTTMGVSRGLIDFAERTSSQSIHVLSPHEIAAWHLGASRLSLDPPSHRHR
jgi:hypothetical protein